MVFTYITNTQRRLWNHARRGRHCWQTHFSTEGACQCHGIDTLHTYYTKQHWKTASQTKKKKKKREMPLILSQSVNLDQKRCDFLLLFCVWLNWSIRGCEVEECPCGFRCSIQCIRCLCVCVCDVCVRFHIFHLLSVCSERTTARTAAALTTYNDNNNN